VLTLTCLLCAKVIRFFVPDQRVFFVFRPNQPQQASGSRQSSALTRLFLLCRAQICDLRGAPTGTGVSG